MSDTDSSLEATKWIYSYRRDGTRELSDEERASYKALGSQFRWRAIGIGVLSVVAFVAGFICLAIAAGGHPFWWAGFIAGMVGFFWVISRCNDQASVGYLFRRGARKGLVDRYIPAVRPEFEVPLNSQLNDAGEPDERYLDWLSDEKFEENLARVVERRPAWFETPAGDAVVLNVEGRPVTSVLNGYPSFFKGP